ncbi:glycosyl transferase group 1 (plasmid) [Thalassoporum mexicanum PCC 7367]|uniref:glycosyltransferase family 4 protein n=1 Tax=Thalassoporum mexicanum TaxID=3457544 RepID=UPI00029F978D|nr:glycosyltransferase family 4 protein [Pseudanabaena sp. PCC 7367]AFY72026.1 glycosyl transferase group 1 [Pseudanabaena sp. PCC 7367]
MNVLHINQSDLVGGASIAGYRLHQGLLGQGVESRLIAGGKISGSEQVTTIPARDYRREKLLNRLTSQLSLHYLHISGTFKIQDHSFYQAANVLNLHNLHGDYFNYLALPSLTEHKPAVWTLHDMWSFTGHCSYSYDCDRWKTGCGQCPYPETYPAITKDISGWEWKLKNWLYGRSQLAIVAPSKWLYEQAQQSMFSQSAKIHHIPYGLDTDLYRPIDKAMCREVLGIPAAKKVLMFSAQSLNNRRKGADLLIQALAQLPEPLKAEIVLLTLGKLGANLFQQTKIETLALGYLDSDRIKAIAYGAADLFILPTRADNLPLVLQESMACGTPMVSFAVGGVPDLVRPGITGELARPEDASHLSEQIAKLLEDDQLRQQMGENCRSIAVAEYALAVQAKAYMKVYDRLLKPGE